MAESQQLSLKWNNHLVLYGQLLKDLCFNEVYSDATLVCQEIYYPVHKMVLANCSQYFKSIFDHTQCNHPFIVLKDIQPKEMELLLKFIYLGEVNTLQADLPALLDGAEYLQIEGLPVYDENGEDHLGIPTTTQKDDAPRKATKRKSSEVQTLDRTKFKKGIFESIDFERLEPDIIFHTESINGDITDVAEPDDQWQDACTSMCNLMYGEAISAADESEADDVIDAATSNETSIQEKNAPIGRSGEDDFAPSKIGRDFFCPKCPYSSTKYFNITRHIMRSHTGEKPYVCNLCSYRSVEKSQLTNHIQRNHSGTGPFVCPHCSFGALTLYTLKRHLKLHDESTVSNKDNKSQISTPL